MINQLKVEMFKIKRFWVVYLIIILLAIAGFIPGYRLFSADKTLTSDIMFSLLVGDTSLMFLYSVVSAWFIGNDFSSRTIHNEIKTGFGRFSVIVSRKIIVFGTAVIFHIIFMGSTMLGFMCRNGFDTDFISMRNFLWLLVVLLQVITGQNIIVCISFAIKKAAAGVVASVCFSFIAFNLLRNFIDADWFNFSFLSLAQDGSTRTLLISCVYAAAVYVMVSVAACKLFSKAQIS